MEAGISSSEKSPSEISISNIVLVNVANVVALTKHP